MKYRKIVIEKLIVEDSTEEEKNILIQSGYKNEGDNYFGEIIFSKTIEEV